MESKILIILFAVVFILATQSCNVHPVCAAYASVEETEERNENV